MLSEKEQHKDGLIATAQTLNELRSRSPRHADDLIVWTDKLFRVAGLRETEDEKRLRHVACWLSDAGWRAHPDYRGEQTLNLITNGNFGAVTHEGRAFLALAIYYRYAGLNAENEAPETVRMLVPPAMLDRARLVGAAFRVAFMISAAQRGVLPHTHFRNQNRKLLLVFDKRASDLAADRVSNRYKQLVRLIGRSGAIVKP
jgi:exopolyphosphatase/guanosine-5'-triphosphate,3'-diphosphate pyrophosphatase